MNTFLLVWNSKRWKWDDLNARKNDIKKNGFFERNWSCGNTTKIQIGDRVFLIRLGEEPKGIIASGKVIKERHRGKHWDPDEDKSIWFVTIRFDRLLNPDEEPILYRENLNNQKLQPMHWDSQMSGVQIPDNVAMNLELKWKTLV